MLMLALGRRLRAQHEAVVTGGWLDVKPWQRPGGDVDAVPEAIFDGLAGKTLGVLGLGAIGGRVARLAAAFGMTVQALARPGEHEREREREHEHGRGGAPRVPLVSLGALLETSDVITLHLRLSAETANLLDAAAFARVKRGAYLVNTARGELVDEDALLGALERGQLAGAALDTLRQEPPPAGHPLLGRADVLLTPHTAWLTRESWRRTLELAFANVERIRTGQPLQHEVGSLGRMTP
jgi:phosphoglycerate dehydrogenase-like enzyme